VGPVNRRDGPGSVVRRSGSSWVVCAKVPVAVRNPAARSRRHALPPSDADEPCVRESRTKKASRRTRTVDRGTASRHGRASHAGGMTRPGRLAPACPVVVWRRQAPVVQLVLAAPGVTRDFRSQARQRPGPLALAPTVKPEPCARRENCPSTPALERSARRPLSRGGGSVRKCLLTVRRPSPAPSPAFPSVIASPPHNPTPPHRGRCRPPSASFFCFAPNVEFCRRKSLVVVDLARLGGSRVVRRCVRSSGCRGGGAFPGRPFFAT